MLQNDALACILSENIQMPQIPTRYVNVYQAPLRQLPRNRELMADFITDFVREMNKKMNRWYCGEI